MHTETITVEHPHIKQGKYSAIKTTDGRWISVPTDQMGGFSKGQTYAIQVEQTQEGYWNFKGFPQAAPTQPQTNGGAQPAQAYDSRSEDMAVMGIIGRCFQGTGLLPPLGDLEDMMRNARQAWRNSHKNKVIAEEDGPPWEM